MSTKQSGLKNFFGKKKSEPTTSAEPQRTDPMADKKKHDTNDSDDDSEEITMPPPKAATSTTTTGGTQGSETPRTPQAPSSVTTATSPPASQAVHGTAKTNSTPNGATPAIAPTTTTTNGAMTSSSHHPPPTSSSTTTTTTTTTSSSQPVPTSSSSKTPANNTPAVCPPTKPRGRGESRKKQLIEMSRTLKEDPCAAVWVKFLTDLCDKCVRVFPFGHESINSLSAPALLPRIPLLRHWGFWSNLSPSLRHCILHVNIPLKRQ